jgi:16S rRNA (guanine527-N7)-methyltransferase
MHAENEVQNLTRILGVKEFIEGHLIDVVEMLKLDTLGNAIIDIGSGGGVPGLLAAAIDLREHRAWFLVESEINKANYLRDTVEKLGLDTVEVLHDRVEAVIDDIEPDTIVARAVGTVEKISAWIWNCSTWNNLILFKSKGWEQEWIDGKLSRFGKKLTVTHTSDYSNSERTRLLISLSRNKK